MKRISSIIHNVNWKSAVSLFSFFFLIIVINLTTSRLIKSYNIYFVSNLYPLGLIVNYISIITVIAFVTWGLFKFKLVQRYPVLSMLILAGIWSNIIERFSFGYVADYINLSFGYANLADFEIWVGAILLNILTWVNLPKEKDTHPHHIAGL
jgi:lipoprotein signal peptidase